MPNQTSMTATLMCSMGMAPSTLMVPPIHRVMAVTPQAANIMDFVPMENILPFGMCMSPANPMVAAATAAAMGVLTPMPCIPATTTPWTPGSPTVMLDNFPALDSVSVCMCMWAGVITIIDPAAITVMIP